MSEQLSQRPCCVLCGSKEEDTKKLVSCASCFPSLVLSIISFCSLYVCVAVVINLLFHIWANNNEYGYAVGVFSAIRIVHLRLGNHLYIHPFFLLV